MNANDKLLTATTAEEHDGKRFDQVLAALFPDYSRARLQAWVKGGRILLDGHQVLPRARVSPGQNIEFRPEIELVSKSAAEPVVLDIVFEDADLIVINKPAGLVVHPGAGNPGGTLMNGLLHYDPELAAIPRAGILHRLDKETSGLLLIARSIAAHTHLVRALEKREIRREYRAVCNGRLTAGGTIDAPIGRHRTQRTRMAVTEGGKPAVTHYRVLARFAAHSFVAVRLETGRTHQIRVHFAHRQHPLVGDPVYGGRLRIPAGASDELQTALRGFGRQALHACDLGFDHPVTGTAMHFHAPLPADLLGLLGTLAEDQISNKPENRSSSQSQDFEAMVWP
jgi:23S rRNA pseudouridine1911/1915/1917 synthase